MMFLPSIQAAGAIAAALDCATLPWRLRPPPPPGPLGRPTGEDCIKKQNSNCVRKAHQRHPAPAGSPVSSERLIVEQSHGRSVDT